METVMKKLITIKSISVLTLVLLVVLGTVLAGDDAAITPLSSLSCTIRVDFVGQLGTTDDEGRLLAYDGEIHGDIEGRILWWLNLTFSQKIGQISYYAARWEIYDLSDNLILAGDDAGTTAIPAGQDGIWRGKGIVTEASTEFEDWIGRQVYESGNVEWDENGLPKGGGGTFRIIPVADFNGDGKVDAADISIMAGNWNTGEPLCDIGPTPLGDGTVNAQDLLVLARQLVGEEVNVEDDIAAIEEHMDLYALGLTTGDLDLWMSLYTEDTVKFAPDAPAVFGKEALRASMEPLLEAFTFEEMDIFDVEIQMAGDYAFARCNFTATMIPKGGGEPAYMDGKDISIMQRQPDGSWKLYWDCWNSNVPPAQ
jgi:uncharacterized protein (TIGR02246 family)